MKAAKKMTWTGGNINNKEFFLNPTRNSELKRVSRAVLSRPERNQ